MQNNATPPAAVPPQSLAVAIRPDGVEYFASGSNRRGEIRGLGRCGIAVGVCASEVLARAARPLPFTPGVLAKHDRGELLDELEAHGGPVFVDSGAFSEVTFGDRGPEVVRPMHDAQWRRILAFYGVAAQRLGDRVALVTPDRVGCQRTTLERLARYSRDLGHLLAYSRARLLVPVQQGAVPMATFYRQSRAALTSWGGDSPRFDSRIVPALPMKKDATALPDLLAFIRDARPRAVHLLGIGPRSRRWTAVLEAIRSVDADVAISSDSVILRSLVGRTNGRGGGPRPLTRAMDLVLEAHPLLEGHEVRARAIQLLAPEPERSSNHVPVLPRLRNTCDHAAPLRSMRGARRVCPELLGPDAAPRPCPYERPLDLRGRRAGSASDARGGPRRPDGGRVRCVAARVPLWHVPPGGRHCGGGPVVSRRKGMSETGGAHVPDADPEPAEDAPARAAEAQEVADAPGAGQAHLVSSEAAAVVEHRTRLDRLVGSYRAPRAINARLDFAAEACHLVSPFPAVGHLPEGFGVQIALVRIQEADTFPTKSADTPYGLGKAALDRIGHALGLSWDPDKSRRLDDASDPYYCHWRAVGTYRMSDGQRCVIKGEKELDARDGSPQVAGKSPKQVAQLREHVMSHAETKARLRAIRSMGIRTAYSRRELDKPFACVRLVFTGQSSDPALAQRFAEMTAASFLGAEAALFASSSSPALPPPPVTHPPPPVGAAPVVEADGSRSDSFPGDE